MSGQKRADEEHAEITTLGAAQREDRRVPSGLVGAQYSP